MSCPINNFDDFDQQAKSYDKKLARVKCAQAFVENIKNTVQIKPHFLALDYGCGTGLVSFPLQPFLQKIILMDNSPSMLAALEEKIKNYHIKNMFPRQLDLTQDILPAEHFNLIYTHMTLHHIPNTINFPLFFMVAEKTA